MNITNQLIEFKRLTNIPWIELSQMSGVSPVYISRLVNGVQKDIASQRADALRRAMVEISPEAAANVLEDFFKPKAEGIEQ